MLFMLLRLLVYDVCAFVACVAPLVRVESGALADRQSARWDRNEKQLRNKQKRRVEVNKKKGLINPFRVNVAYERYATQMLSGRFSVNWRSCN